MPEASHPTGMNGDSTARVLFGMPDLATLREDGYVAVDMHVHTEHSDGLIRVKDALRRGRRIGASFAVTDHNAVSGAVAAIREAGPARKLVGLTVEGGIPRHGYTVLHDGVEVGKVASGSFSPTLESGIATAYLPAELASVGTRLDVEIRKKTVPATVVKPPFVSKTSLSA